jgi:hypothetical protein
MSKLSDEIKEMLIADINKGDEQSLTHLRDTLCATLGDGNPNVISVEFTLSQLDYLEAWSAKTSGMQLDSIIRLLIDTMIRMVPHQKMK